MKIIYFLSNSIIITFILIAICFALIEKKNVFELFLKGVVDGQKIVIELFPTLLALIFAVGMLNASGFIVFLANLFSPFFNILKIDKALISLIIIRPISGSTTIAIATELMKQYGADSKIGLIASCIMGSTETTIYVASIYSSKIRIKNVKEVIIIGLIADLIGIITSCMAFKFGLLN